VIVVARLADLPTGNGSDQDLSVEERDGELIDLAG
jgi:hypothetical protein